MHLPMGSSLPNTHYRVCIKALYFDTEGRLFVCEEDDRSFDLPGGGLDHEEDPVVALSREIKEEMGCEAKVFSQPLCTRVRKNKNGVYSFSVGYAVQIDLSTFVPSQECMAYHFFDMQYLREHRDQFHRLHPVIDEYEMICERYNKTIL